MKIIAQVKNQPCLQNKFFLDFLNNMTLKKKLTVIANVAIIVITVLKNPLEIKKIRFKLTHNKT